MELPWAVEVDVLLCGLVDLGLKSHTKEVPPVHSYYIASHYIKLSICTMFCISFTVLSTRSLFGYDAHIVM